MRMNPIVLLGSTANGVLAVGWWLIDKQSWFDVGWLVTVVIGVALYGYASIASAEH